MIDNYIKNKEKDIIHFSAIGGIGMSAIAEILHIMGYNIQGSDMAENANTKRLAESGIKIFIGQNEENVKGVSLIVRSTAITDTNPEIIGAKKYNIPILHRSDALAFVMSFKRGIAIAGSHGKSTTTSMTAIVLDNIGLNSTVICGSIINNYNDNARIGTGEYLLAEADESDGTFIKYPAEIKTISNIDREHMDFYGTLENEIEYFKKFINETPKNGLVSICFDDEELRKIYSSLDDKSNIITYGFHKDADVQVSNVRAAKTGLTYDVNFIKENKVYKDLFLPLYGVHNALNSLNSIIIARHLGGTEEQIRKGLAAFQGTQRRFTKVGEVDNIMIIDDYAHHPTEIIATIKAAKNILEGDEKLIVVFQGHRYTRVRDSFKEFTECLNEPDEVIVADIFLAREEPIPGINQDVLFDGINKNRSGKNTYKLKDENELPELVNKLAKPGDIVLCLGAGSISKWARALEGNIKKIRGL